MKVTLTISNRDLGLVLELLSKEANIIRNEACNNLTNTSYSRQISREDRLRSIRKDLAAQRKSPPAPTVVQSAVERLIERVRKAYPQTTWNGGAS